MQKSITYILLAVFLSVWSTAALAGINVSTNAYGPLSAINLSVNITGDTPDNGKTKLVWVAAYVPGSGFFFQSNTGLWVAWNTGPVPNPVSSTTSDTVSISILNGTLDLTGLSGTQIYVGFAQNASELINNGEYKLAYTIPPLPVNNVAPIVVDAGPANASNNNNTAYVTLTVCVPGTSNCSTVDHVLLDTGSVGLRLFKSVLDANVAAQLPAVVDTQGRTIAECGSFSSGYVWGSVRRADLSIAGEKGQSVPMQLIDSGFASIPAICAAAGTALSTPTTIGIGANGVLGIKPSQTDCPGCSMGNLIGSSGYPYYVCAASSCVQAIMPASMQVPNPISLFASDNNGALIELPTVPAAGEASVTGSLIFGIGTQANNVLGSARIITTTADGTFTTVYKGRTFAQSYIDTGSLGYIFDDASIAQCTLFGINFFCPNTTLSLGATLAGSNGVSVVTSFNVGNPYTFNLQQDVLPLVGISASGATVSSSAPTQTFIWGLPFFYGKNIFFAIDGKGTPGGMGPFVAF